MIALMVAYTVLSSLALYQFHADNARQDRELRNLRGMSRDQAATTEYLTHPKTMTDRIFEWYKREG